MSSAPAATTTTTLRFAQEELLELTRTNSKTVVGGGPLFASSEYALDDSGIDDESGVWCLRIGAYVKPRRAWVVRIYRYSRNPITTLVRSSAVARIMERTDAFKNKILVDFRYRYLLNGGDGGGAVDLLDNGHYWRIGAAFLKQQLTLRSLITRLSLTCTPRSRFAQVPRK